MAMPSGAPSGAPGAGGRPGAGTRAPKALTGAGGDGSIPAVPRSRWTRGRVPALSQEAAMSKSAFMSTSLHRPRRLVARTALRLAAVLGVAAACTLGWIGAGFAQVIDQNLWVTD